jgi:hypothetical protein
MITISNYLKRNGFRKILWDVWVPEDIDPRGWPAPGSKILTLDRALDEFGEPQRGRYVVSQLVFRKMWEGDNCYWQTQSCLSLRLKFKTARWDAAFAAVVRHIPLTLRGDKLWQASYWYNRKYVSD